VWVQAVGAFFNLQITQPTLTFALSCWIRESWYVAFLTFSISKYLTVISIIQQLEPSV